MSHKIVTWEPEQEKIYNWTLADLVKSSPYTKEDTIELLADGRFVINYTPSNIGHAETYAKLVGTTPSILEALDRVQSANLTYPL